MFTVIGTLEKKGATLGEDQDNQVIAPFSCVQDRLTGQSALSHDSGDRPQPRRDAEN